ncbi:MAG TPA: L-histidine N(alpha)-methyltransferase [Candidatus Saccharimonadales bacterium]|nr:L-histidine N(alpha)-methyltransferase [Candidatus Saccharimonadales bacterium]
MKYFKNTELAKIYNISEKSVRNWIDAAQAGRINLQLQEEKGKWYITNTVKNTSLVEELVAKGKKYKNSRGFRMVRPSAKFYELYTSKQIIDIISSLDIYREIPVQYTYFNSGAKRWDSYTRHLLEEDASNALTNTVNLLDINLNYLDQLLEGCTGVNIIDLGVGNALPVRGVLQHFLDKGRLKRYIGIDISRELLDLAEQNIHEWFDGTVHFEGHVRDIAYERFDDLLVSDAFGADAGSTINLVLFLGGTLANFREPNHVLTTIHDSMGKQDLLLYSKKLDNQKARRFFELAAPGNQAIELVLQMLNIDKSFYTLDQLFDDQKRAREVYAKLEIALAIEFELKGQKRIIELNKGDGILLWRAKHQNVVEVISQFDENDFDLLQGTRSKDQTYLLTISKIKIGQ